MKYIMPFNSIDITRNSAPQYFFDLRYESPIIHYALRDLIDLNTESIIFKLISNVKDYNLEVHLLNK